MFAKPILTTHARRCDLVGMLDCDPARFELYRSRFPEHTAVATYGEEEFGKMIDETKPDVVIVAGATIRMRVILLPPWKGIWMSSRKTDGHDG